MVTASLKTSKSSDTSSVLSVLQKLIEVQSSVVAACMDEQEMQWYQWLTKPRPQV